MNENLVIAFRFDRRTDIARVEKDPAVLWNKCSTFLDATVKMEAPAALPLPLLSAATTFSTDKIKDLLQSAMERQEGCFIQYKKDEAGDVIAITAMSPVELPCTEEEPPEAPATSPIAGVIALADALLQASAVGFPTEGDMRLMRLVNYINTYAVAGPCLCRKCLDARGEIREEGPNNKKGYVVFFDVTLKEGADAEVLRRLISECSHGAMSYLKLLDGEEHSFPEAAVWLGDAPLMLVLFGMGQLLGLWELNTPEFNPTEKAAEKIQLAGKMTIKAILK